MAKQKHSRAQGLDQQTLRAGATLEVLIERILPGGVGLAHAMGQTVLVGLAAPGDYLRVRLERVRGQVAFAKLLEVLKPSPVRVEPPCPYFGRCGGCDFQQLSYQAQLAAKVEIIRDCLHRIARLDQPLEIPITGSPAAWHYRSRAQWQLDTQRQALGYFERGSHTVCDVSVCPVLVPELQETLSDLRGRVQAGTLPYALTEFQAVAGETGASLYPPLDEERAREVSRTLRGERYSFDAEGFFQINQELLETLIDAAITDAHGETCVDLYCGVGLFTLPLARRFEHVTGVEASAPAVTYARRNLSNAVLNNARIECASVSNWLREHTHAHAPVDYLLLDPPRAGVEDGAVKGILALRPRHISYVSCDPATLARDLKELIAGGYTLDSVAAFDMFPQTHHVETVAHLAASDSTQETVAA